MVEMVTYWDGRSQDTQTLTMDAFLEKFPEEGPRLLKAAAERETKRKIMLEGRTEVQKELARIFKEKLDEYRKAFPDGEDIDLESINFYM